MKSFSNLKQKIYSTLRWSEQYTKTDMVYLAKGGFWLTAGQVVSSLSSFLLAIAFANLLPQETYGTYKYVLSVAGILAIPTLSGINTAITQAVARGYEGSLIPALKTKICWGLLGALASITIAGYYFINDNITLTISFLIISVFIPLISSFGIYSTFLQGKKRFDVSAKYQIISQIIAIAVLITTIFLTKNIFLILLSYFIPWTLLRFIFFKITVEKFPPNQSEDPQTIIYGKHLSLINIIGTIVQQIDKILIFHYLGPVKLAIYSIALAPPEQIKSLLSNLGALVLPKFSQRSRDEIKKALFPKMLKFALVIVLITIIYIVVAPFIYKIFFPQYIGSIIFSQIFAISLIGTIIILPHSALQSQKAQKELYVLNIAGPLVQLLLLIVAIYFYGLLGAILVRVFIRIFNSLFAYWLIQKNS